MLKLKVKPTYKYLVHASTVEPDRLPASSVRGTRAVRMANATTTCLAQRASVLEELVGREDRGTGSFGQRQGIGRMTRQGCFVMGLSDVERGGYPGSVFIQHPRSTRVLKWTENLSMSSNTGMDSGRARVPGPDGQPHSLGSARPAQAVGLYLPARQSLSYVRGSGSVGILSHGDSPFHLYYAGLAFVLP